jgi:hypothetical protein
MIRPLAHSAAALPPLRQRFLLLLAALVSFLVTPARAADADPAPDDAVARLQRKIDAGQAKLSYDPQRGYLDTLLGELKLPPSSQSLVFTKTSLQRDQISPENPRAIYFNDDTYVGYVRGGNVLEIATLDPKQGNTAFYTLEQSSGERPRFQRETDSCFQCHDGAMTRYTPGLMLRSVAADAKGFPILADGTTLITQETPLTERWGGWYVTGTTGANSRHRGNTIVRQDARDSDSAFASARAEFARGTSQDVTDLTPFCDLSAYAEKHSDVVALMVLAHQTEMHNLMSRARSVVERALADERAINEVTGKPANSPRSESTMSRIKNAGEPLLKYMLFCNEAKLTAHVFGTSDFARDFAAQGPRDPQGRSLRDFDLHARLFKFPCSYLIYSQQWDNLPPPLLDYLYRRLWLICREKEKGHDYDHLTTDDRETIRQILLETKSGLPEYWKQQPK